jgi:hypothetical protein
MFSLKSLLTSVLVAAVFIVAFLNSSPMWASVIVTLTVLLLVAASVSSYLFPDKRPFLACALITGLIYGGAAFVRPLGLQDSLITTQVFYERWYSGRDFPARTEPDFDKPSLFLLISLPFKDTYVPKYVYEGFWESQRIGHCATALTLAVIAGLAGSYVARKRQVVLRG